MLITREEQVQRVCEFYTELLPALRSSHKAAPLLTNEMSFTSVVEGDEERLFEAALPATQEATPPPPPPELLGSDAEAEDGGTDFEEAREGPSSPPSSVLSEPPPQVMFACPPPLFNLNYLV